MLSRDLGLLRCSETSLVAGELVIAAGRRAMLFPHWVPPTGDLNVTVTSFLYSSLPTRVSIWPKLAFGDRLNPQRPHCNSSATSVLQE